MYKRKNNVKLLVIIHIIKNYSVLHSLIEATVLIILIIFSIVGSEEFWICSILIWDIG